ncbi:MAG: DUF1697 domain-containing protein [Deltaproteobacteria bacterium]|nr:MAG: DUF1697 domain-containing protein [Deltaproteobacteria bacterium]
MVRTIALLRGVNVGGRHRLPMADLRALLEGLGYQGVRTVLQSGNAVFDAPGDADCAAAITAAIADRFGLTVPVVTRTVDQLRAVAAGHRFAARASDDRQLHVYFLADLPDARAVAALDPDRSPPDRFEVVGREVHLFCPRGLARTTLTNAWFDRQLGTVSTGRNWRTIGRLLAMAEG